MEITLGAYGFPDNGTQIEERESDGARAIILKGTDHMGRPKRLAMTIYDGWMDIFPIRSTGTNPDSEKSVIICARGGMYAQYDASEPYIYISQVITGNDDKEFSEDELFPIEQISYEDEELYGTGAYGKVELVLKDGTKRIIDYAGIEGRMSL